MKSIISTNFFAAKNDYKTLPIPTKIPNGVFEISWIGPKWFQKLAKLGLGFFGFKNWYGKEFYGNDQAINIFKSSNETSLIKNYPMRIQILKSNIDGNDCILVSYPPKTRFPWPHIIDEFRYFDEKTLLGQSYAKFFPFFPLPFFLIRKE